MNARATIIITYFNETTSLNDAIASALSQECDDPFEVLVVDDGGLVPAAEIIDHDIINNDKLKIFRRENGGLGAARDTVTITANLPSQTLYLQIFILALVQPQSGI